MAVSNPIDELPDCFSHAIFERFPDWRDLTKWSEGLPGSDVMEIAVPQPGTNRVLRLSASNKEITIVFDAWHTHIGPFLGITIEEAVATVMDMIEGFLCEERLVVVVHRDGAWLHSGLEYRVAPSDPEPRATTRIYSWRGTFDNLIQA